MNHILVIHVLGNLVFDVSMVRELGEWVCSFIFLVGSDLSCRKFCVWMAASNHLPGVGWSLLRHAACIIRGEHNLKPSASGMFLITRIMVFRPHCWGGDFIAFATGQLISHFCLGKNCESSLFLQFTSSSRKLKDVLSNLALLSLVT